MWLYRSSAGDVYIDEYLEGNICKYGVRFNGILRGGYDSPQAAADDVYTCGAFFDEIRKIKCRPHDLSEWLRVKAK